MKISNKWIKLYYSFQLEQVNNSDLKLGEFVRNYTNEAYSSVKDAFKRIEREEYNKLHILYRDTNELIINTPDCVITYTNKRKTNPNSQHVLF